MNRLFGVIWIYLTRPLCWLLFVVIAACLTIGLSLSLDTYQDYDPYAFAKTKNIFVGLRTVDSQNTLNAAMEEQYGKPVQVLYESLASDLGYRNLKDDSTGIPSQVIIADSEAAERLKQLTFPKSTQWLNTGDLKVQQSTIDQVGDITSLEHVKLAIPKSSTAPLDLSPLAKLVNLKSLDLGYVLDIDSLKPLQSLPHLKTLTIADFSFVTSKNMREVAAIKSLRQLFLPKIEIDSPSLDALSELNGSSLKQVYFANAPLEAAKFEAAGKLIPDLRVQSSQYLTGRIAKGIGFVWLMLMTHLLGIHFLALFTLPAAELTPGYRSTQRRVAWGVMLVLISLIAWYLWSCKIDFWLAVAVSACSTLLYLRFATLIQTRKTLQATAERLFGLLIVIGGIAIFSYAMQNPLELEYLLSRPPWWWVTLLSMLAIFLAANWNRRMSSICRDRVASGNEPILTFVDMQNALAKLQAQRTNDQAEPFERMTNWMFGGGLVLLVGVLIYPYLPTSGYSQMIEPFLRGSLPSLAFFAMVLILSKWWSRIPYVATMITRPPCRRSHIKQLFWSVAADFARAIPLLAAAAYVIGSRFVDKFDSAAEAGIVTILFVAGIVGMAYALTLAVISVRSTRWIIAVCILMILGSGVFSGLVIFISKASSSWILEAGLFVILSTLGVALLGGAAATTILMWRRYQKIEWASFLS
ncbi:protein phosphatase 1 regulatory subunit 42 [Mariniblastus sp.]|nr:protein phosphatase 1 regulatory subunit 42 [Mariniblastus sp.]